MLVFEYNALDQGFKKKEDREKISRYLASFNRNWDTYDNWECLHYLISTKKIERVYLNK